MDNVERIEVRKLYVGSMTLFGLLYGLVLGIISALVLIILGLISADSVSALAVYGSGFNAVLISSAIVLFFNAISGAVGMFFVALIYNLVAKMGGRIHLGLAEFEEKPKKSQSSNIGASAKNTVSSKMASQKSYSGNLNAGKLVGAKGKKK